MTFELKREDAQIVDNAIRAGLIHSPDDVVEVGVETLRVRLRSRVSTELTPRQEAVQRMQEFGDEYRLTLGGRVTRDLLHEGHRC
jgi:hypothetical protein